MNLTRKRIDALLRAADEVLASPLTFDGDKEEESYRETLKEAADALAERMNKPTRRRRKQ